MRRFSLLLFVSFLTGAFAFAQTTEVSNETLERAKAYDFTRFLYNNEKYGATGVFDTTNGRLQIHFENVAKDKDNPLVYRVRGASRHMKQVTPFKGSIRITEITKATGALNDMLNAMPGMKTEDSRMADGVERGDYVLVNGTFDLREDSTKKFSGVFSGDVQFALRVKPDGSLSNDWNRSESNYYRNFVYRGSWRAHTKKFSAPAAWSDGRIPVKEGVDVGQHEFRIAPQFEKHGWKRNENGDYEDNPEYWWRMK
ncbi:MAG TPA: hypothetical protein VEY71_00515 [Chitinophagales bacterium]|nr:hypothetical protein [Chitinophagales bacterium]